MSIKVEMFVKLPYIIKLKEDKDYIFTFKFDDFEMFCLEMRHNDESNDEIYDERYYGNSCENIRIEAIFNNLDYSIYNSDINPNRAIENQEYQINLPLKETRIVFNEVNKRLNQITSYLRNETNIFWIENIHINPIAYSFGTEIQFNFYSPNTRMLKLCKETRNYTEYYMNDGYRGIKEVDEKVFDNLDTEGNYVSVPFDYLNKSQKSLYDRNYEDFIINCSISVESFIRGYIGQIEPENDIVYNKLSALNHNYLDKYYNILLKYLKGKSLNELDEASYTHLKRMYSLRNAIMHKGYIDEKDLKKVGLEKLTFQELNSILESAQKCYKLISSL